ncbi:hypothetical protein QS468_05970 [Bacillus subtilis]|nr:hypothetical protein [Pseudomonas sp. A29(2023)]MDL5592242.1 hypothetical protein [Bacillus subtilis]
MLSKIRTSEKVVNRAVALKILNTSVEIIFKKQIKHMTSYVDVVFETLDERLSKATHRVKTTYGNEDQESDHLILGILTARESTHRHIFLNSTVMTVYSMIEANLGLLVDFLSAQEIGDVNYPAFKKKLRHTLKASNKKLKSTKGYSELAVMFRYLIVQHGFDFSSQRKQLRIVESFRALRNAVAHNGGRYTEKNLAKVSRFCREDANPRPPYMFQADIESLKQFVAAVEIVFLSIRKQLAGMAEA